MPTKPRFIGQWASGDSSRLYAFLMLGGAHPHVVAYNDDPEGRAELAERVRDGTVMAVVRGHQLDVSIQDTVTFSDNCRAVSDMKTRPGII